MSESSADKVSLAKGGSTTRRPARAGRPARPDVPKVPVPRTIDLATIVGGVLVVALWVRGLGLLGSDSTLLRYVIHSNETASKPDKSFDADSAVHSLRVGTFFNAVLVTAIVLLLVWALRRTRSASAARWGVLIFFILLGIPFSVIPTRGLPFIAQAAGVVSGAAAIAMIVLVFLPPSSEYFRACRDALTPPELRGQPRPGLGSLFKPRPPAGARTPVTNTRPAATRPPGSSGSKAKAKVRSDAEAVAKGAELARSRAKSNKSRRAE